jgi:hypothetical protein
MAQAFSDELGTWLKSSSPKTLGSLSQVFGEKSFAITILLLMFLPSLPLPTGGITHVFEAVVMLLALEMIIGQRTIWLPKKWQQIKLGEKTIGRAIPFIEARIRWFERFARPRMSNVLEQPLFLRLAGLIILIFTIAAFIAPPFTGLDTLPALGAASIALGLILEDFVIVVLGCVFGAAGIGLIIGLSALIGEGVSRLL